jgi:hypothetical protein
MIVNVNDRECFVSRMDSVAAKRSASMLRKTMIVLAEAASTVSAMRAAFAHGHRAGMRGPHCGWLRVKLVAPTSQAAALFYQQLFEMGQI